MDIGGGEGHLLATILEANPAVQGVLFDQPVVSQLIGDRDLVSELVGAAGRRGMDANAWVVLLHVDRGRPFVLGGPAERRPCGGMGRQCRGSVRRAGVAARAQVIDDDIFVHLEKTCARFQLAYLEAREQIVAQEDSIRVASLLPTAARA